MGYTRDEGIAALVELRALAGMVETPAAMAEEWDGLSPTEREHLEGIHRRARETKLDYRTDVSTDKKALMNRIARGLQSVLPPGHGFALLVFEFNKLGDMLYVSNADRADVLKSMQEFLQKQAS